MSVSAYAADSETYLYNGVELPALPDWDKEKYPYAVITDWAADVEAGLYALEVFAEPAFRDGDGAVLAPKSGGKQTWLCYLDGNTAVIEGEVPAGEWLDPWSRPGEDGNSLLEVLVWSNHDILDNRGSIYFAASDPVPVASKYSPTLTSRTHSFTDTTVITEVTLMGLDPSKVYEVYWAIYDDTGALLSHGVSEQIGEITGMETATGFSRIVNLQPGTTYSLYWHLAENDSVLDTTFSNTVTTLGLAPGGTGDSGNSGSSGGSADSGGTGSDFTGGEDDISGSQGDGNTGILMQILNKLSAIFDFLTGDKEVEDTPEQALKDATSEVTQTVTDTFFGGDAAGQTVTSGNVGDLANTQGTIKQLFASDYTFGDFLAIFSGDSYYGFFSPEVAMDLNPLAYGSPAVVDMDDPYNQSAYFENLEKVRGKHG